MTKSETIPKMPRADIIREAARMLKEGKATHAVKEYLESVNSPFGQSASTVSLLNTVLGSGCIELFEAVAVGSVPLAQAVDAVNHNKKANKGDQLPIGRPIDPTKGTESRTAKCLANMVPHIAKRKHDADARQWLFENYKTATREQLEVLISPKKLTDADLQVIASRFADVDPRGVITPEGWTERVFVTGPYEPPKTNKASELRVAIIEAAAHSGWQTVVETRSGRKKVDKAIAIRQITTYTNKGMATES